jgi:hypothetical protein
MIAQRFYYPHSGIRPDPDKAAITGSENAEAF